MLIKAVDHVCADSVGPDNTAFLSRGILGLLSHACVANKPHARKTKRSMFFFTLFNTSTVFSFLKSQMVVVVMVVVVVVVVPRSILWFTPLQRGTANAETEGLNVRMRKCHRFSLIEPGGSLNEMNKALHASLSARNSACLSSAFVVHSTSFSSAFLLTESGMRYEKWVSFYSIFDEPCFALYAFTSAIYRALNLKILTS